MTADRRAAALLAAGAVASSAAPELARPLRELRELLAVVVEELDRHVSESEGPMPLPWEDTRLMRQKLTRAYLLSREIARLAAHLDGAVGRSEAVEAVDVNKLVEAAVALARHQIAAETETFVDLGSMPSIQAAPGELVLVLARLVMVAADSARPVEGAALSVRTRCEPAREGSGEVAVVTIADNGAGVAADLSGPFGLAEVVAQSLGGTFEGASEAGTGSMFELRIPVRR